MSEYQEIIINWKFQEKWDPESFIERHNKDVLYQIYCNSHIYGRNVLAYIGKTNQSFNQRYSQHEKSFWQFANNINYAVGTIDIQDFGPLEIPESILIANHKPFYNKDFIHDLPAVAKEKKIIIINNGDHGMLKNSCTNYWWAIDENQP
jgi:hypothetical protein